MFMRRIVMPINRSINAAPFPMITITAIQFQQKPYVHKTSLMKENAKFVDIQDKSLCHEVSEFYFRNLFERSKIYAVHDSESSSFRICPCLYSKWSKR